MSERFPSNERLKSTKLIDRLFTEGDSIFQFPVKLIFLKLENSEAVKLNTGVSVPKRNFKRAVDRNYLKRLLRESYRKNRGFLLNNMSGNYALMFIYTSKKPVDFQYLSTAMEKLMKKFFETEKANEKEATK